MSIGSCYLCPSPLPSRAIASRFRSRAYATFCAAVIFEKSGEPSAFFGSPPLAAEAAATAGVRDAGAGDLGGSGERAGAAAPVLDIVTFTFGRPAPGGSRGGVAVGFAAGTVVPVPA
jgi:hypothetical protein